MRLWHEGLIESLVPERELPARPLMEAGWTAKVAREAMVVAIIIISCFSLCYVEVMIYYYLASKGHVSQLQIWRIHLCGATWS